jgi:hypothetical protein
MVRYQKKMYFNIILSNRIYNIVTKVSQVINFYYLFLVKPSFFKKNSPVNSPLLESGLFHEKHFFFSFGISIDQMNRWFCWCRCCIDFPGRGCKYGLVSSFQWCCSCCHLPTTLWHTLFVPWVNSLEILLKFGCWFNIRVVKTEMDAANWYWYKLIILN